MVAGIVIPPVVVELLKDTAIWAGLKLGNAAAAKYAKDAVDKLNEQLGKIWARLGGQSQNAAEALTALESQDLAALSDLQTYLRDAMKQDPELKRLVDELAQELEAAQSQSAGDTIMTQNNAEGAIGAQGPNAQAAKQIVNIEKVENLTLPSPPDT